MRAHLNYTLNADALGLDIATMEMRIVGPLHQESVEHTVARSYQRNRRTPAPNRPEVADPADYPIRPLPIASVLRTPTRLRGPSLVLVRRVAENHSPRFQRPAHIRDPPLKIPILIKDHF